MLSLNELKDLFPPDEEINSSNNNTSSIDFITHRKEYLNSQSAFVVFKKQNINFNSNAFLSQHTIESESPVLIYKNIADVSHKLARYLNQKRLDQMNFYGITGTNGKSTTVKLFTDLLNHVDANKNCASLGTLGLNYDNKKEKTFNTTPFPLDLHYIIRHADQMGARSIALEVSSHSLQENRIEGINFNRIAFTNLSHDHLDYHKSMEEYKKAKLKLLQYCSNAPIVNMDCDHFKTIVDFKPEAFTYSVNNINAKLYTSDCTYNKDGIQGNIHYLESIQEFNCRLYGEHNLSNLLCAISMLLSDGYVFEDLCKHIHQLKAPTGRLELVPSNSGEVFIDYAHTPDALEQTLSTILKHFTDKEIITLFGCGGDRDKSKRPAMARIAENYSKDVYITNDNPRTEDASKILMDIKNGFSNSFNVIEIEDREKAINTALSKINEKQILIIAGKGHEDWQEENNIKKFFSDHEICRQNYTKK